MEKQYYYPTIEEFHVGFRYEQFTHEGGMSWSGRLHDAIEKKWIKTIFKIGNLYSLSEVRNYIDSGFIRVRHLDHDDIIEAGWKESHEDNFKYFKSYRIKGFVLNIINNTNNIVITEDSWLDMYPKLFEGKIKNYNQLLDVMEMLGIKKEK